MAAHDTCGRCGGRLRGSPGEACPACLMELGLATGLDSGTRLGPYEVVEPIGAGGMGQVYRARDERLKRDVAIKVLPASFSSDPDRLRRFEREAQSASAMNHPNIVSVHDVGTHDGSPYIVTELLEGQTLRERLNAGTLSTRQAMDYAAQIAKGLSAAHAKGIVHRDLKPENVFVTRDELVKILDFGIAKLSRGGDAALDGETAPGVILGTVSYMSPEQVKGEAVDARSDIFSFGSILYEMLSGTPAFRRGSPPETMAAILTKEADLPAGVPARLRRIVSQCLEKDPARRLQSAGDIAFHLSSPSAPALLSAPHAPGRRRALIVAAVLVALALAAAAVLVRRTAPSTTASVKRIAVLPFENQGAAEDDYFADGIADAVRGKLTSLPGIQVIARGSSAPYKKTTKTPEQIARELGVGYLLTATVRWQKGTGGESRVMVSPELVEVQASGAATSKWEQPFDTALTDVLRVQGEIAARVATSLGGALSADEARRLAETPTANLAAYDAFLKGDAATKSMGDKSSTSLRKALGYYEQAVALDPGFAQAWARLSEAESTLYANGNRTRELAERAHQAAERAMTLAPGRPEGYLSLGFFEFAVANAYSPALTEYARGLRVAPGNPELLSAAALAERNSGRWDLAIEHFHQAERLDPRSVITQFRLGQALFWLRRYAEARRAYDRALALAPANLEAIRWKVMTFLGDGDLAGARAALAASAKDVEPVTLVAHMAAQNLAWVLDEKQRELLVRLTPSAFDGDRGDWGLALADAYSLEGEQAKARVYAEEARRANEELLHAGPPVSPCGACLAIPLAYLGQKEEAIRRGELAASSTQFVRDPVGAAATRQDLAKIYVLVGETEKAIDLLELLLKIPSDFSPGWLRIDPTFDPLRGRPRFQRLVAARS